MPLVLQARREYANWPRRLPTGTDEGVSEQGRGIERYEMKMEEAAGAIKVSLTGSCSRRPPAAELQCNA